MNTRPRTTERTLLLSRQGPVRVGGLSGPEPHISDLRIPLFAKLTSEPYISGSEPHIASPNPTPLAPNPT